MIPVWLMNITVFFVPLYIGYWIGRWDAYNKEKKQKEKGA